MRIFPLGENAVTVEFGDLISHELNDKALALAEYFNAHPFPGFIESVPAYTSTAVFFDVVTVRSSIENNAFDAVESLLKTAIADLNSAQPKTAHVVEIPVSFDGNDSIDLAEMADALQIPPDDIIEIFLARTYRVYMLGFLPGFPYMGEVDERIAVPRRDSPRTKVPKGSVGIAGRQTGVYPLESPGGWQIIGRTDVEMFDAVNDEPCFLSPGDEVKFIRA